jgi:4'-phosphopantetheinyl transferase
MGVPKSDVPKLERQERGFGAVGVPESPESVVVPSVVGVPKSPKSVGVPKPYAHIEFRRDPRGRPYLAAIGSENTKKIAEIDVNWSHSGDWLLAACGQGVRLGIDLELLRPRPKALALARRFFAAEETAALGALAENPDALQLRFTQLWCAKEAVLKADGGGLSFGLHRLRFAVDGHPAQPHLLACDPALGAREDWRLHAWAPWPGYWATLAYRPWPAPGDLDASDPPYFAP